MAIEFTNGAVVSRFHSTGNGELLAAFQYRADADDWAEMKVQKDADEGLATRLVRTSLYDGKSREFHPTPPNTAASSSPG